MMETFCLAESFYGGRVIFGDGDVLVGGVILGGGDVLVGGVILGGGDVLVRKKSDIIASFMQAISIEKLPVYGRLR